MNQIIPEIILASQSKPRKELLSKLKIAFSVIPAHIDESPLPNESIYHTVERLSTTKGATILEKLLVEKLKNKETPNDLIIISSDQIAAFNNQIYGKPGNYANALQQLKLFSGQTIEFITGLCVTKYNHHTTQHETIYCHEISKVKLKNLNDTQIKNYLEKEQPFNAAASFQLESLGISLVEKLETDDYNAIIGLPIIKLIKILNKLNLDILSI
jgi:MAF protein